MPLFIININISNPKIEILTLIFTEMLNIAFTKTSRVIKTPKILA